MKMFLFHFILFFLPLISDGRLIQMQLSRSSYRFCCLIKKNWLIPDIWITARCSSELGSWNTGRDHGSILVVRVFSLLSFSIDKASATSVFDLFCYVYDSTVFSKEKVQASKSCWVSRSNSSGCHTVTVVVFRLDVTPAPVTKQRLPKHHRDLQPLHP